MGEPSEYMGQINNYGLKLRRSGTSAWVFHCWYSRSEFSEFDPKQFLPHENPPIRLTKGDIIRVVIDAGHLRFLVERNGASVWYSSRIDLSVAGFVENETKLAIAVNLFSNSPA